MLAQLNDCIGGLLHLGPNVITFRTLLHLGQLLHLGLQHLSQSNTCRVESAEEQTAPVHFK